MAIHALGNTSIQDRLLRRSKALRPKPRRLKRSARARARAFGVKHDPKLGVLKNVIMICYQDKQMYLLAAAVADRIDSCVATAYDKQTRKTYVLIDKPGIEK